MNIRISLGLLAAFLCTETAIGQTDTIARKLDEVVITGQYNPQAVKKSVYQVKVISRADIDRQAGNNLADLLNQSLNINIIPSASTGKSSVRLFGLDAQYFKILIDNIPVVNDEGLGNNTDLTQINLDDVQQIEIVEGSMGVEYGANALSGIINIITKKSAGSRWEITPFIQEETVGKEYSLLNRGRHIQSLKVGHNFNSKLYANATVTTNYFKGFLNGQKGPDYGLNDGLRGYQWLPKDQVNAKGFLGYNLQDHNLFYKFEYFNEATDYYSPNVIENPNAMFALNNPMTHNDNTFKTERFFHHLNASGRFSFMNYDLSLSYQTQTRNIREFDYWINQRYETNVREFEYESRKVYYSKGIFSNFLNNETVDFQLGYEINEIDGFVSYATGIIFDGAVQRKLGSYDFFASTEINLNNRFSVRPGARILLSSEFATQAAYSLSTKYVLGRNYELRGVVGSAPRLPNYEELYTYFVDVNHDSRGNPDLKPEQGLSASLYLNKTIEKDNNIFKGTLSFFLLDVQDRIETIQYTNTEGKLAFTYNNIDTFRTMGGTINGSALLGSWNLNAGFTFAGTSKELGGGSLSDDRYLYAVQANANIGFTVPKAGTVISAFYKYTGPQYQFIQRTVNVTETVLVKGKQNDFSWVDASIRQPFLNKKLEVTVGARNLLDITRINTSDSGGSAHAGPATSILMGYGRSYFFKLLYRCNF